MEDQDRVSQTSSVVTISSFPVIQKSDEKVQTFGKGCRAAKRDPNFPVIIRGWLNKKDSSGLKLWKRRWFVLSNYCLFYYKDSREESALGSIPLPSYSVLFCTSRECKNRKHTFKVVHRGMRSYFLSADTQEDMLGWVRALSQSACMESDPSINRRCSSYQDFTQIGGSSESVELPHSPSLGEGLSKSSGHVQSTPKEPRHLTGGRMGTPHAEQKGRRSVQPSPTPKTPSPPDVSRRRGCGPNHEDGPHPCHPGQLTPPRLSEYMGTGSLTPRGQLGSRPHTPVGRVDIRPQDDLGMPQTLSYAPASPQLDFRSTPQTPVTERWPSLSKPTPTYASLHHIPGGRRQLGKNYSTGAHTDLLPPLPPSSRASHPPHHHHHHHHHHRSHMSVCLLPSAMPAKPDLFKERETPPLRPIESDADAVLTRLCGCDKLLQSLSIELAQLQVDKDSVQGALEMTRLQLEEWTSTGFQVQEGVLIQKALLQEELVTIRARMCDVSLEMERVWSQYERMESELSLFRSHLQHVCNFGMPQEQSQAQRELWMMEDILAGLKVNREHFRLLLGIQSQQMYPKTPPHPGSPGSSTEHGGPPMGLDQDVPARPPLPEELQDTIQSRDKEHGWLEPTYEGIYSGPVDPLRRRSGSHHDTQESQSTSRWTMPDTTSKEPSIGYYPQKGRMTEEEQMERIKRNQQRQTNRKHATLPTPFSQNQGQSSNPREEIPFPLRVTRVVTAVLPTSLLARRVSVEDPPPELANPLPEQISPEIQQRLVDQGKRILNKPARKLSMEVSDRSGRLQTETDQHQPAPRLARVPQEPASDRPRHQKRQANPTRSSREDPWPEASEADPADTMRTLGQTGIDGVTREAGAEAWPSLPSPPALDPDLNLNQEQREAKLKRVERIRERVIRSAVRESSVVPGHQPITRERQKGPRTLINEMQRSNRAISASGPLEGLVSGCDDDNGLSHCGRQSSCGTQQDEEEEDERIKGQSSHIETKGLHGYAGTKTKHKDHSQRKCVKKHKQKPSLSPNNKLSVTISKDDGSKAFEKMSEDELEEELAELSAIHGERTSANLRTEWFLSTQQWRGFIPLQNHGIEPLFDEYMSDTDHQAAGHNDVADSNEISSAVSQSLEKMLENHSLFYKIACDINISDSDIPRNDEQQNVQSSTKSEDVEGWTKLMSAAKDEACCIGSLAETRIKGQNTSSEDKGNPTTKEKHQDWSPTEHSAHTVNTSSKTSIIPARELCIYEDTPNQEDLPNGTVSGLERKMGPQESLCEPVGLHVVPKTNQAFSMTECEKTVEENKPEDELLVREQVDQEGTAELMKSSSTCDDRKEIVQEQSSEPTMMTSKTNSGQEDGRMIRSASFGQARVTVLRTSL